LSVLAVLREDTQADEALSVINEFLTRLHRMPKPVISVIEGAAVGAGLNLALHADFVIATNNALLQEPFVHLGLTTDFGGTYLLPRLVGLAQAKRLALLGERLSGQEAERIGFIYKAVDAERLAEEVEKLIMTVRRVPKQAYAVTKEGLGRSQGMELEQTLEWEKEQQPRLIAHPDFLSLIAAKRKK
jgi:enoyl-CoA hydratase/carnithine racemase